MEFQKKYAESNDQFKKLKNNIQKSTMALEQRQVYLQQLMDADKSFSSPIIPDANEDNKAADNKTSDNKAADNKTSDNNQNTEENKPISLNNTSPFTIDSGASSVYNIHQKQMANLQFNISRIEQQQESLAQLMIDHISNKISYVENTLKNSGIKSSMLMKLATNKSSAFLGMGGPFILYAENNDINDLSENEPFAKLYAHYNKLIGLENAIQHMPIGLPTKKYYISSGFGIRKDPFKNKWARHNGLDMAGWWKTPIYASANGTVTKAGSNGSYGNFIEIDHGNGFRSRYGHLSKIKVKKGEHVTLEQEIGLMGSTGRSTSPHLHYEIWFNGVPINPQKIFKASNNVLKIQRQEYDG
ncbi:MAG: M23 family metallopeptidase [Emcibacter sp.]|nr:M23 family metallopeptidase [Emcibacter sp.]